MQTNDFSYIRGKNLSLYSNNQFKRKNAIKDVLRTNNEAIIVWGFYHLRVNFESLKSLLKRGFALCSFENKEITLIIN